MCIQKYDKQWNQFRDDWCLARLKDVEAGMALLKKRATPMMVASSNVMKCQATGDTHTMKVCPVKGKEDIRISYSQKIHVPKSCMSKTVETFKGGNKKAPTEFGLLRMIRTKYACVDERNLQASVYETPTEQNRFGHTHTANGPDMPRAVATEAVDAESAEAVAPEVVGNVDGQEDDEAGKLDEGVIEVNGQLLEIDD
jgi:hypothetical protein